MTKVLILGCGMRKPEDTKDTKYIGIDMRNFKGVDYVLYIGKDKFPFSADYFDEIQADNVFEHLGWNDTEDYLINCMEECWRVLKPKGFLYIIVPRFPSGSSIVHPEHRRFFVPDSFSFFQVPYKGIDVHGYLKGFWHGSILPKTNKNTIIAKFYPNKPNGKYPYIKVKRKDE